MDVRRQNGGDQANGRNLILCMLVDKGNSLHCLEFADKGYEIQEKEAASIVQKQLCN